MKECSQYQGYRSARTLKSHRTAVEIPISRWWRIAVVVRPNDGRSVKIGACHCPLFKLFMTEDVWISWKGFRRCATIARCTDKPQDDLSSASALKDDQGFNYEVIADVMHLNGKPTIHVIDSATAFQAARFLRTVSATETWETLRALSIDTYLGSPEVLTHDAGTKFASAEFRAEAKLVGITCHQVPVEAHWSIGKIERYHAPLRRAYEIIRAETRDAVSSDAALQMALKTVNDTAGPDG